ncbi:MAG TPA: glycosyltransferase family 1 protein [Candidatus Acidoferrales bacterium]|jgi:glycosyltransferase involved in cell wall biosynthesis|nr:glycosyltransferase family 1 protein [Candidatus Acidoferrales bacterium]
MTFALDATYSLGDTLSGVGLYSHEMLFGMAAAHPEARFDFCYRPHRYFRSWRAKLPGNARRRWLGEPMGSLFESSPRDAALFHGLNQRLPRIPLRRAIATFHDLFVLTGEYSTPDFRARFREQARDAAERSAAVIAVSEFTKSQVVSLLGVDPAKVHAIHHGIRPLAFPVLPREKIVLNVGAIQKRKNTARLVEAFATVDPAWRLVLAGSSGYGSAGILEGIARSPARQRISVLGYVSPGDLAAWYARAQIFAFPSLDEGFGMPILEAMAAGVPVVTSNRSALPEVAGEAAILVDPENTEALGEALRSLVRDQDLRRELVRLGTGRAHLFTWEKAVRETWEVYQSTLG